MAGISDFYPPGPPVVPTNLCAPTPQYRLRVFIVLGSLILFLLGYLGLLFGSAYGVIWAVVTPVHRQVEVRQVSPAWSHAPGQPTVTRTYVRDDNGSVFCRVILVAGGSLLFLFLIKGLFKRSRRDRSLMREISEEEQPRLFAFLRELCAEAGAKLPRRVYVSPEVNAAVFYTSSVLNLVWPTPKNLHIGLGLVNAIGLSEFKALLAHEFGHFCQRSMKLGIYVYTANRIIGDMVYGRDWFDTFLLRMRNVDIRIAVFAWAVWGVVWALRKVLTGCFQAINFCNSALSRQMEFNADLVAASVAGSDAVVHLLARCEFAEKSMNQAMSDLAAAAHHQLYTCDLFYHQNHAARYLRQVAKDPHLGEPPPVPEDPNFTVEVFEPGSTGVPLMWATHPSNYDREQNAKRAYMRAPIDERSPWLLFSNGEELRERVTGKFYRVVVKVRKDAELSDAETVQAFIDDEHAETTYDERYHGLYDDRFVEPGDLVDSAMGPHTVEALAKAHADLYPADLKDRVAEFQEHQAEHHLLSHLKSGALRVKGRDFEFRKRRYFASDVPRLLKRIGRDLEAEMADLAAIDRGVFLCHYRMAEQLNAELRVELAKRYGFHLRVQEILSTLNNTEARVQGLVAFASSKEQLSAAQYQGVAAGLRDAHRALAGCLEKARTMQMPDLKNMTTGQALDEFLLDKRLVGGLGFSRSISGEWIGKFLKQLEGIRHKIRRIHFKSLGGILALQERIARDWFANVAAAPEVIVTEEATPPP
jgi:Zn-dependent protease with chaperone function